MFRLELQTNYYIIYVMRKNEQKQNRKRLNSHTASQKLPPLNKKVIGSSDKSSNLASITHQDQGIVGLLSEYFIKNNFITTLDCFQRQCGDKGFKPNNKFIEAFRHEMIQAFDKGDRETFMHRFAQYVPLSMRARDLQILKLQFYIQVYFFVFSIHPQLGKKRSIDKISKEAFVGYLEGRGSALSSSAEFLQYYALAYLQKPQQHQTFKTIFTKQWIFQLKKRVVYFIEKLYPMGKVPILVHIYDKYLEKNADKMERSEQFVTEADQEMQLQIQEQIEEESKIFVPNNASNNKGSSLLTNSRGQETLSNNHNTLNKNIYDNTTQREKESLTLKISELEEEKYELVKFIESVKNKYQSLQNNYKDFTDAAQNTLIQSQSKWFKITQEFYNIASSLLEVCTRMQNGEPITDPTLVQKIGKKLNKYQSFINMNIEDLISENVDFSLFERPQHDISTDIMGKKHNNSNNYFNNNHSNSASNNNNIQNMNSILNGLNINLPSNNQYAKVIQLDFKKVKEILEKDDIEFQNQKCYLLEALKWRLTKTRGIMLKREIVLSLTINDIFNLRSQENNGHTLNLLLNSPNQAILLRTMQVINALCKDYYGRDYLSSEMLIKKTMEVLKSEQTEENIKVIIISTLQQLSVRRLVQIYMIEGDMIKWVTNKLHRQRQTMSSYLMQYSTALLINLLLRKEGLVKSEQIKQEILTTLINLMEVEVIQIRGYVHGALYPLFSKKVFREKAKQYGLEENIKFLLENTNVQSLVHQLNYLEKQLMRDDQTDEKDNDQDYDLDQIFDEEVGEDFELEIELEGGEGLSGQELLMKKYSLTGPDAIKQLNTIKQEVDITLKKQSVYMANSFSERPGTNNPVLGQLRRNPSNNNSVYSNKSSNRILRSELNNRSQILINNKRNVQGTAEERLDTVHPDGSDKDVSIKDFIEEENGNQGGDIFHNRGVLKSGASVRSSFRNGANNSSKVMENGNKTPHDQQQILGNQSFSQSLQKVQGQSRVEKPYEVTKQYKAAFVTRQKLVRTPPEK